MKRVNRMNRVNRSLGYRCLLVTVTTWLVGLVLSYCPPLVCLPVLTALTFGAWLFYVKVFKKVLTGTDDKEDDDDTLPESAS